MGEKIGYPPQRQRGPGEENGIANPMFVNISADDKNVMITWQLSQGNSMCEQYSQWTGIEDNSWTDPVALSQKLSVCSNESSFLRSTDDSVLYMSNIVERLFLLAWNGEQWSDPVSILKGFFDTSVNNPVIYTGQKGIVDNDGQHVYLVGYDMGVGGDIWLSTLNLDSIKDQFPASKKWSEPELLSSSSSEFSSLKLLSSENDRFHMFWVQKDQLGPSSEKSTIHYSIFDGQQWSSPVKIFPATDSDVRKLDALVENQSLYLVWEEGATGKIFFSWTNVEEARNPTGWISPIQLTEDQIGGSNPTMVIDHLGFIYVAYVVPVNEYRGVYIIKSIDNGMTWTSPVRVDGSSMPNWYIVDTPLLEVGSDQMLNILWSVKSLSGRDEWTTLYANQSIDEGATWSTAEKVVDGILSYVGLTESSSNLLIRFWQKKDTNQNIYLWNQFSMDSGRTWSVPSSPSGINQIIGVPTTTVDKIGKVHLFVVEREGSLNQDIKHLVWENEKWLSDSLLSISTDIGGIVSDLTAAISPSGELLLVYRGKILDGSSSKLTDAMFFSHQNIDHSAPAAIPLTKFTDEPPLLTPSAISTVIIQTPTIVQTKQAINQNITFPSTGSNAYLGLFIGAGLTVFLIALFLVYILVFRKR